MSFVKHHYDALGSSKPLTKRSRQQLRTYPIRDFNNLLKRRIFEHMCQFVKPGCRILDVGCGRGGDIHKYSALQPSFVKFLDISTTSIAEARRRYTAGGLKYHAEFSVVDCFSPDLYEEVAADAQYDIVVCHFALHYAFGTQKCTEDFFQIINFILKIGGHFLATFPNYTAIRARALDHETKTWKSFGNEIMKVEFAHQVPDSQAMGFGVSYRFSLEDAVDNCQEYVVPTPLLDHYLKNLNFQKLIHCGFLEASMQLNTMNAFPQDPVLADVCSFYAVLLTVKAEPAVAEEMPRRDNYKGQLQEFCQARGYHLPQYKDAPVNDWKQWVATVTLNIGGYCWTEMSTPQTTKREAHHDAAKKMMACLSRENFDQTWHLEPQSVTATEITDDDDISTIIPTITRTATTIDTADLIVHVDADHISFVSPDIVRKYVSVFFIFYYGYGSDLGHLRGFNKDEDKNVELRQATSPLKNVADSMILIQASAIATKRPGIAQVVVSRDSTVYHAEILIKNTTCATEKCALIKMLDNDE